MKIIKIVNVDKGHEVFAITENFDDALEWFKYFYIPSERVEFSFLMTFVDSNTRRLTVKIKTKDIYTEDIEEEFRMELTDYGALIISPEYYYANRRNKID